MRTGIGLMAAALLLGACAMSDERLGAYVADGANYRVLSCEQLAGTEVGFKTRLAELDALMQKAATGTGGGVVNAIAYRPERITAQGSLDAVHKVQAEKNCKKPEQPAAAPTPVPPKSGSSPKR